MLNCKSVLIIIIALEVLFASAFAGNEIRVKPDQPVMGRMQYRTDPICVEPASIALCNVSRADRIVYVRFRGIGFDIDDVVLSSVKIFDRIRTYSTDSARVEDGWVVTDVHILRLIRMFRPICQTVCSKITVGFDLKSGQHIVLEHDFCILVERGDVNLDCEVDTEDLICLSDFLYHGYPVIFEDLMDIECDGDIDEDDLAALEEIISP